MCSDGSGRSVAWYARLLGVQEVVSSNLTAPTIFSGVFEGMAVSQRFLKQQKNKSAPILQPNGYWKDR
jgi:hypothetical protein